MIDQKNKIFTEEERAEIEHGFFLIKDYITGGLCDRVRRDYYKKLDNPDTHEEAIFQDRCYDCLLNQQHGMYCEWGKLLKVYQNIIAIDDGETIEED